MNNYIHNHPYRLKDFIQFNPKEKLPKGAIARKITMEQLSPNNRYVESNIFEEFKGGSKFRNGDTIMARITPCLENGKTAYITSLNENELAFGSTEFIVFREIEGKSNSKYIYYLLKTPQIRDIAIKSMVGSSGRQRVQQNVLENYEVLLPTLDKQIEIANILSSLDDKIELNRRINENLEQQAQALFKSWFVDFEPFKGGKFVDSELGMIPEGWRVGTIGDYCKIRSGFAFKSSWWTEKGVKIVKIKNISSSGILNMDDCSYVSKENVSKAKEFSLKPGDILIAMTGATIGKFCLVPALKEEMYVNQRVGKFFLGENPIMKIPFIHGLLKCENIISQIINKGQGSAQPNISGNDIETIPIIYPPEDIISKYNELVSPYFSMIIENISACDFISQLRDTLLPRLMSGELAITDVDDRSIFQ